ncbi:MAG: hypothetical protein SOT81_07890 [Treponema sp.]|nr:hypothetical protein [Treponema sp.]
MILGTILYYIATSSAVLFYGIGINRTISIKDNFSDSLISCFKALMTGASTTALTYLISMWLLVPVHLAEIYPILAVVLFLIFTTLSEIFIGIGLDNTPTEFTIPLLSVFLGINEGLSIGLAVIITCTCIVSFYLLVIIFHSVKERISFYTTDSGLKTYAVLLICLAAAIIAISGCNNTWLSMIFGGGAK